MCGFLSRTLEIIAVHGDGSAERTEVLAEPCSVGAVALTDGRVAFSDGESLRTVEVPDD